MLLDRGDVSLDDVATTLGLVDDPDVLELSPVYAAKLDEAGVVAFDGERIERGPAFEEVAPFLKWFRNERGDEAPGDDS